MDIRLYQIMKILFKLIGLITIVSLVSCGGSNSGGGLVGYSVGGTVTGLQGSITLRNNTTDVLTLSSSGSFSFNDKLNSGVSYNVDIQTQPAGQTCTVSNASGIIDNADVSNVMVACVDNITLSGSYQAAPLIQVDSDINDPFAVANISNNYPETQTIPNFSTVHGFATLAGTSASTGTDRTLDGDRFATSEDESDFYRVSLQANQTIRLQVVDFSGVDVFKGDLDLYLYDAVSGSLHSSSKLTGEFGIITVPADGDYFIEVFAFSGSSKYTLSLNGVTPANAKRQTSVDFIPGQSIIKFKANTQVNNFKANNQQMALSHRKNTRAALARFDLSSVSGASVSGKVKTKPSFLDELKQKNFESYQKIKTLREIKRLNLRDDIEYAEPNYVRRPLLVPNDQFYNLQWHYPAINLPQAWDITTGSKSGGGNVIVAVVDTGVFLSHPDLDANLVNGYDFISSPTISLDGDGRDSNPDDPGDGGSSGSSSFHGTHVSGTIAALTNNNRGVAGVSWKTDTKVMPIRALGFGGGTSFDIMDGVRYAAGLDTVTQPQPARPADIINLSIGGGPYSQFEQDIFIEVRNAGVIVVAAAGNDSSDAPGYPASYDGVISVSAVGPAVQLASYSNFGSLIDITAPGGSGGVDGVFSTSASGFNDEVNIGGDTRVAGYRSLSGTSMASPHVAGVAALMKAAYPGMSPRDFDILLQAGVITDDISNDGASLRNDSFGFGLVNALKAVQEAQKLQAGGALPAFLSVNPSAFDFQASDTSMTLTTDNPGGGNFTISVVGSASWVTVVPVAIDPTTKLGSYSISVNRVGLADAQYQSTIMVTYSGDINGTLNIPVSMQVGPLSTTGDTGFQYGILADFDVLLNNSGDPTVSVLTFGSPTNGLYNFSFNGVRPGNYVILAGSDMDNDFLLCDPGEACGLIPSVLEVINRNADGLNFGSQFDQGIDVITTLFNNNPVPLLPLQRLASP